MKVKVQIDGKKKLIEHGILPVDELYTLADCEEATLYLSRDNDIDIPLRLGEYLVIHGGEQFFVGSSTLENNPPLRKKVRPEFNGTRALSLPKAKTLGKDIKSQDETFPDGRLFVDIANGVDVEIADEMLLVVQESDSFFVIPATEDDLIDTEECGKHNRRPPKGRKYRIRIDGERCVVNNAELTGMAILGLVGKDTKEWLLNQKWHGGRRVRINPEDVVDFSQKGIERFETIPKQAQQGNV